MDRAARCVKAAPGHVGVQGESIPDRKETMVRIVCKRAARKLQMKAARIEATSELLEEAIQLRDQQVGRSQGQKNRSRSVVIDRQEQSNLSSTARGSLSKQ
jgi:hypothetical protein